MLPHSRCERTADLYRVAKHLRLLLLKTRYINLRRCLAFEIV